jgi:hypothetical protein
MAGTTPIYALRFPSLGDQPDGATQIQRLAEDVEAQLARMDTIPLIQVFIANGTFTKASNARYVEAELQAAGGGGGGCPSGTGQGSGGGGGGGGWALKRWAASALGSSIPVAVGAGGTGGAFNAPTGGTGGTTSFNGVSCTGGSGGIQGTSTSGTTASGGGVGGTATGGDVNVPGGSGQHGRIYNGLTIGTEHGGHSRLGFGGQSRLSVGTGLTGVGFGSGASGCLTTNTNGTGGTGSPGIAILRTWF